MADDKTPVQIAEEVKKQDLADSVDASLSPRKVQSQGSSGGDSPRRSYPQNKARNFASGGQQHFQKRGGAGKDRKRSQATNSPTTATPQQSSSVVVAEGGQEVSTGVGGEGEGGSQNRKNKTKYSVKKRTPPKQEVEIRPNDVYVSERSHYLAQLSKCKKLFDKGHTEIYVHGLGNAIPRALNIAFELKKFYHDTVDYTVNTSTVEIFDDLIPVDDPNQLPIVRKRSVSSVDIKVYRCVDIP